MLAGLTEVIPSPASVCLNLSLEICFSTLTGFFLRCFRVAFDSPIITSQASMNLVTSSISPCNRLCFIKCLYASLRSSSSPLRASLYSSNSISQSFLIRLA